MLDFFCSFEGCSISMSYNDWPSTIATRNSSACVALINIRFMVVSSRAQPRGTPGSTPVITEPKRTRIRLWGNFQRYRPWANPRERLSTFVSLRGPEYAERFPVCHGPESAAISVCPSDRLTWSPPWGVVSGLSGFAVGKLSAGTPAKSGRYLAQLVYRMDPMTANKRPESPAEPA